jgi:hypothetical protein
MGITKASQFELADGATLHANARAMLIEEGRRRYFAKCGWKNFDSAYGIVRFA